MVLAFQFCFPLDLSFRSFIRLILFIFFELKLTWSIFTAHTVFSYSTRLRFDLPARSPILTQTFLAFQWLSIDDLSDIRRSTSANHWSDYVSLINAHTHPLNTCLQITKVHGRTHQQKKFVASTWIFLKSSSNPSEFRHLWRRHPRGFWGEFFFFFYKYNPQAKSIYISQLDSLSKEKKRKGHEQVFLDCCGDRKESLSPSVFASI